MHFLKDSTDKIKQNYGHLISKLKREIEDSRHVQDVANSLTFYHQKFEQELENCSTMDKLFSIISKNCSFYNFGLIKFLAKEFGSSSLKKRLRRYKQKFRDYAKRRLCECPSNAFGRLENSEKVFKIKTEEGTSSISTLEDLEQYQFELNKILGHRLLRLLSVEEGCLELTFSTFSSIDIYTLTERQQKALKKLKVVRVSYEDKLIADFRIASTAEINTGDTQSSSCKLHKTHILAPELARILLPP